MSKFLRLVQENQPGDDSGSRYTISISGPAEFPDIKISGDTYANRIYQEILQIINGEDQEGVDELTVNKAIEDEAAMDPNGLAGKAVERRKEKINRAVKDYEQQTLGL